MDKYIRKRKRNLEKSNELCDPIPAKKTQIFSKIKNDNLNCDYGILFSTSEAQSLFEQCEKEISYNSGQLSQVFLFGKWHDIPRKQAAFGDVGITYKYSNNVVPAKPWIPLLTKINNDIKRVTGHCFNFVLINRYADGRDHMGEHKDDEDELVKGSPIASLSLGQPRDFIFRHQDARGKGDHKAGAPPPVKIRLESGSLLMMNSPTNDFWYHSLPKRSLKTAPNVRINMTFRQVLRVDRRSQFS